MCIRDSYITKPFDVREVVARIKATFRRLEKTNDAPPARNELRLHFAGQMCIRDRD